jgi:N-succinyldiaminopimelate aminotransferase
VPAGWEGDDAAFARALYEAEHVTVLPGSFLARDFKAGNPGKGRIRMALVAETAECLEAAERIARFVRAHPQKVPK